MLNFQLNPYACQQLKAPDITLFIQEVSKLVDHKLMTNKQIRSLVPHIFNLPEENETWNPKKKTCALRDVTSLEKGINIISSLPEDGQSHVLKFANGMQAWLVHKIYCKDEAVKQYAALALNDLKVGYFFSNPTEVLLRHIFKELIFNSDLKEINQLLNKHRSEQKAVDQAKSNLRLTVEKTAQVSTFCLHFLAFPFAIYAAYLTVIHTKKLFSELKIDYLPQLANIIINYVSVEVIQIGNVIYDLACKIFEHRWAIFFSYLIVSRTRLNQYRIVRIPLYSVYKISFLPTKIANLPFKAARYVFWNVKSKAQSMSLTMNQGANFLEAVRIQYELKQAEDLWVSQATQLKALTQPQP